MVAPDSTFGMTASAGSGASGTALGLAAASDGEADGSLLAASVAGAMVLTAVLGLVVWVAPVQAPTARTAAMPRAMTRLSICIFVTPPRCSSRARTWLVVLTANAPSLAGAASSVTDHLLPGGSVRDGRPGGPGTVGGRSRAGRRDAVVAGGGVRRAVPTPGPRDGDGTPPACFPLRRQDLDHVGGQQLGGRRGGPP